MKKMKSIILLTTIMLSLVGCSESFLDRPPKEQFSVDIAFSSLENIEGAALGLYERGRSHLEDNSICLYKACLTDLVKPGTSLTDQGNFNRIARLVDLDATTESIRDIWNTNYTGLHRANSILAVIDNTVINENLATEVRRRDIVKGEALFFRAYFHMMLVQHWDNIVLANRVFEDPNEKLTLSSKQAVYDLIISDLIEAVGLLPTAAEAGTRGRASVGAANQLLAKAYLDYACYFDDNTAWEKAALSAKAVIDDPSYELVGVDTVFSTLNQENKEIVFSWQFSNADANHKQRVSQQYYPLYDRVLGVARTFEQGGRPWARLSPTEYYWSLFEENDLRLNAWHKRYWVYDVDNVATGDSLPDGFNLGDTVTAEGLLTENGLGMLDVEPTTNKYWEGEELGRTIDDAEGYRNIIEYRVSDAYLMAAEGYLKAGQASVGQPYLDAVRDRAGVDPITLNEQNILDEYARELGHEGHRFPILKRLGILESSVKAHSPEVGNNVSSRNVRWPIPKVFVDLTRVPQNPGWE